MAELIARSYVVQGKVQGVGFRDFVLRRATGLGITGTVSNAPDGTVRAHAQGTPEQLAAFEAHLRQGPPFSDVRQVQVSDAPVSRHSRFEIQR